METINYTVWCYKTCWRVTCNDYRTEYRRITDGACITMQDILHGEINYIKQEVEKRGAKAVFTTEIQESDKKLRTLQDYCAEEIANRIINLEVM